MVIQKVKHRKNTRIYLNFDIDKKDIIKRIAKALEHAIQLSKKEAEPF